MLQKIRGEINIKADKNLTEEIFIEFTKLFCLQIFPVKEKGYIAYVIKGREKYNEEKLLKLLRKYEDYITYFVLKVDDFEQDKFVRIIKNSKGASHYKDTGDLQVRHINEETERLW